MTQDVTTVPVPTLPMPRDMVCRLLIALLEKQGGVLSLTREELARYGDESANIALAIEPDGDGGARLIAINYDRPGGETHVRGKGVFIDTTR